MSSLDKENLPTILVIDDDPSVIKQLEVELSAGHYQVMTAPDAKSAINLLEKDRVCNLIITDIIMPGGDGISLIKTLKAKTRTKRIPIMVYSSAHDQTTVAKALEAGAIDFIAKPLQPSGVCNRVQRALDRGAVTVLIIDDNLVILDLIARVVSREGFQIMVATNAEDGLRLFHDKRVDAVISDIGLPGMNGLEFLVCVKEKNSRTPVLLITGNGGQFTKDDAVAAGADGYITKPFKNTEIASKLNSLI